jgi:hypothetical protein
MPCAVSAPAKSEHASKMPMDAWSGERSNPVPHKRNAVAT